MKWMIVLLITLGTYFLLASRFTGIYAPARKALRGRAPRPLTHLQVLQNQLAEKITPSLNLDPIEKAQTETLLQNLGHTESPELFQARAMPNDDVIVTGTWIPHTNTPFAVEVYQQNIEDDGYTKDDVFSGEGTTDTQIVQDAFGTSVLNEKYPGFHLTDDSSANATTINGDGSTVLKLYYDRNTADVSYAYNYTPKNAPELPVKTIIRFGTTVTVAEAPSLAGYDFSGWVSDQADLSGGTFSMKKLERRMNRGRSWTTSDALHSAPKKSVHQRNHKVLA